eukprot:CAMPEP_0116017428 /NCGR_PEP_ID=MMETSP0321-20121206/8043_1 /TAXON_ID=163516 /ORGANISM="Leptocylindrus danicus var. danicus, Strain B650" /LENGTH=650 /DNA_ID=CAMNT_0003487621 /DNA_START=204 /DNA_END=2156 /DNA_ORIENTATION=-
MEQEDTPESSVKQSRAPRRVRCGECAGCKAEECGECKFCKSKKKFGGDGSSRGACIRKRCTNLLPAGSKPPVSATVSSKKRARGKGKLEEDRHNEEYLEKLTDLEDQRERKWKEAGEALFPAVIPLGRERVYGQLVRRISMSKCDAPGCSVMSNDDDDESSMLKCCGFKCNRQFHRECFENVLKSMYASDLSDAAELKINELDRMPSPKSIICPDCDYYGSSICLLQYFEECANQRAEYGSSREYVLSRLAKAEEENCSDDDDSSEDDGEDDDQMKIIRERKSNLGEMGYPGKYPKSELSLVASFLDAVNSKTAPNCRKSKKPPQKNSSAANKESTNSKEHKLRKTLHPSVLVGSPIRLYCPIDNSYHVGRIFDWRRAQNLNQSIDVASQYWGEGEVPFLIEYLVIFRAGDNGRKRALQQWMVLEEHALAVGLSLIWMSNVERKNKWPREYIPLEKRKQDGFSPGQILLRTSMELVPVRKFICEEECSVGNYYAICYVFGHGGHRNANLEHDAVDFFYSFFENERLRSQNYEVAASVAMAISEYQERLRVIKWHKLHLDQHFHPQAMSILDSENLSLLCADEEADYPKGCQLSGRGVDRLWIADLMELQAPNNVKFRTKDSIAAIQCKPVKSKHKAMQTLIRQRKASSSK